MPNYCVAVCDDDKSDRESISALTARLLQQAGEEPRVDCFRSPGELIQAQTGGTRWNLILLDILMDGPRGLALAEKLRAMGDETDLVFVTSCAEYALDGYRSYPVSYLVKPVTRETLLPILERCLARHKKTPVLSLALKEGGTAAIPMADITYIEVFRRELVVHCKDRSLHGLGVLGEVAQQLPSTRFYRSHRSFLVNLEQVSGVHRYFFSLRCGGKVPIAVHAYQEAQQRWLDYFM